METFPRRCGGCESADPHHKGLRSLHLCPTPNRSLLLTSPHCWRGSSWTRHWTRFCACHTSFVRCMQLHTPGNPPRTPLCSVSCNDWLHYKMMRRREWTVRQALLHPCLLQLPPPHLATYQQEGAALSGCCPHGFESEECQFPNSLLSASFLLDNLDGGWW